jgi:Cys-tRNA(Pro)/Cys-tRNA(Cys) deacylase
MAKGTPATVALAKVGIAFTLHAYHYDPGDEGVGWQAAQTLGLDLARVFKTLMIEAGRERLCVLLSSERSVNLRRLAAFAGAKDAALMAPAGAERATGYRVGGISPFGQKKRARTIVDRAALAFPTIFVSGGRRGLEIEVAPGDLVSLLAAEVMDVT